ncbi:MAG TPA: hypothetical protein VH481_04505 [Nitrososphaeraceae archaeon]
MIRILSISGFFITYITITRFFQTIRTERSAPWRKDKPIHDILFLSALTTFTFYAYPALRS